MKIKTSRGQCLRIPHLAALRDTLLPKLISGELQVLTAFTESIVEEAVLDWLREPGYLIIPGQDALPAAGDVLHNPLNGRKNHGISLPAIHFQRDPHRTGEIR